MKFLIKKRRIYFYANKYNFQIYKYLNLIDNNILKIIITQNIFLPSYFIIDLIFRLLHHIFQKVRLEFFLVIFVQVFP